MKRWLMCTAALSIGLLLVCCGEEQESDSDRDAGTGQDVGSRGGNGGEGSGGVGGVATGGSPDGGAGKGGSSGSPSTGGASGQAGTAGAGGTVEEAFNIYFHQDFENSTIGTYLESEWVRDWNDPAWSNRQVPPSIARDEDDPVNPTKTMQFDFPQGSVGPSEGGGQWETEFGTQLEEVYFSYDLMFMPGFQYQMGGKIPGLRGLPDVPSCQPATSSEGFKLSNMFKEEGRIVYYTYDKDKVNLCGDTYQWNVYSGPGEWHNLAFRLVLNTIGASAGNNDGILEGYFDGLMVFQKTDFRFRDQASVKIDGIKVYTFFGGSTDDWANPIDEWLRLDNFYLFDFKDGVDVPRGLTPSPAGRILTLPPN